MRFLDPKKLREKLQDEDTPIDEVVALAPSFVSFVPTQGVLIQLMKKMKEITTENEADDLLWKGFFATEGINKNGDKYRVYQPHRIEDTFSRFNIYLP